MIHLDDVWRNVSSRIGFFTWETREKIPAKTGIYAWFFPLRIYSKSPYDFVKEMDQIFFYDSSTESGPNKKVNVDFNWDRIDLNITKASIDKSDNSTISQKWNKIINDEKASSILKTTIMESSILMPPLYVGRTDNLYERYLQHVRGGEQNDFHRRFSDFAREKNMKCKIADLLFVCLITEKEEIDSSLSRDLSDVIEEIMKLLCKPIYGKK